MITINERIDELEELIEDSMVEEIIFMEEKYYPSHYMLTDNLSSDDQERVRLINTCSTIQATINNYSYLVGSTPNIQTKLTCSNLIIWSIELLSLYEAMLSILGLGSYKYDFNRTNLKIN